MQCTLILADEGPEYKPKVLFANSKMPAPVHIWRHLHQKEWERNHFTYRAPQDRALILIFPSLTFLISSSNFFWWLLSIYSLTAQYPSASCCHLYCSLTYRMYPSLVKNFSQGELSAGEVSDYQLTADNQTLQYQGDLRYLWYKQVYEWFC